MTSIKLIVNGAKVRAEVDGILTSGSVGIPVAIQYDSIWDNLTKTLVCTSGKFGPSGTPKAIININTAATVAHEALIANNHLYLGIEGRNADGSLVICTAWADCGTVLPGVDAGADPSAQPSLSVWAQLQQQINKLITNGIRNESGDTPQNPVSAEPAKEDIPKAFFTGDVSGMDKENAKDMTIAYRSKSQSFDGVVEMKWQGSSSLSYPKKNFTVKLFTDATKETKLKKDFRGWGKQSKFCLKANYIDHSHARNIVSARIWSDIVRSRSDYGSLPEALRNSPNNGAIDGFPIKVYINGAYQGLYTWNIPKDGWMFNMDEDNAGHCVLCCDANNSATPGTVNTTHPASQFRGNYSGIWEVEFPDAISADHVTLFNNLIACIKDADNETFKATLGNYLDVQSALDYYLFAYFGGFVDSLAKNMILMAYDTTKWYCSMYDMDSTWGLTVNGGSFNSATILCPEDYQEDYSLLWQRIERLFYRELKDRYAELRGGALSDANIIERFERFTDVISKELYDEDAVVFPGIPSASTNNIRQIRGYLLSRGAYVDECISALDGTSFVDRDGDGEDDYAIHCTSITLSANELTFDGGGIQTLTATVLPADTTQEVTWEIDNAGVATIENGVVTAVYNGTATVTARCGEQSATCAVTVSGIVDDPLTRITWLENTTYNGKTGAATTATGEYATPKIMLTQGLYRFDTTDSGANNKSQFMWDSDGNYIVWDVGRYCALANYIPGWQYAYKCYAPNGLDTGKVTLTRVDNSAAAVSPFSVSLNDLTWEIYESRADADVTALFAEHGVTTDNYTTAIQKLNHFCWIGYYMYNAPTPTSTSYVVLNLYVRSGQLRLRMLNLLTEANVSDFFAANNVSLEVN